MLVKFVHDNVAVIAKVLLQEVEERFGSSVQILLTRNFFLIIATSKIQFLRTVRCANHNTLLLEVLWLQGIPPSNCVGCDIVQADHAPEAGVAQGIFHGILVRHHGRIQEEVEEGLEEEVERDKEEDAQTTTCTCMDGMR